MLVLAWGERDAIRTLNARNDAIRTGHDAATRERILKAASRLFREDGIAAVGLARIMAEADLTVGAVYTHFKSKEALLRETLRFSLRARHEELVQALRDGNLLSFCAPCARGCIETTLDASLALPAAPGVLRMAV